MVSTNGNGRILGADGQPLDNPFVIAPHATFSSIANTLSRTYRFTWDEALKDLPSNALSMHRDVFLLGTLRERQMPTAQLPWNLEPEDTKSEHQKAVADQLQQIITATPHWQSFLMNLLDAIWYGRMASQIEWRKKVVGGQPRWCVNRHVPLNGDKIQYNYDGVPLIAVNPTLAVNWPGLEILYTDRYPAALLNKPEYRKRFVIHTHETDDADYFEGEMAGSIYGVGVRSRIYWAWWLRNELLSWCIDYMQTVGTLGLRVFYYDSSNPESKAQAEAAAQMQGHRGVLIWPNPPGDEKHGPRVELLNPTVSGIEALKGMIETYFERHIERYMIGQTLSSKAESTGLGSSVAELHASTKFRILRFDANNLEECLTHELVATARDLNRLPGGFPIYFRFAIPDPAQKEKMDSVKTIIGLGGKVVIHEAYEPTGLSVPKEGDETLGGQAEGQPGEEGGAPGEGAGKPPGIPKDYSSTYVGPHPPGGEERWMPTGRGIRGGQHWKLKAKEAGLSDKGAGAVAQLMGPEKEKFARSYFDSPDRYSYRSDSIAEIFEGAHGWYLIVTGERNGQRMGRLLDMDTGVEGPERPVEWLVAHTPYENWIRYNGTYDSLLRSLTGSVGRHAKADNGDGRLGSVDSFESPEEAKVSELSVDFAAIVERCARYLHDGPDQYATIYRGQNPPGGTAAGWVEIPRPASMPLKSGGEGRGGKFWEKKPKEKSQQTPTEVHGRIESAKGDKEALAALAPELAKMSVKQLKELKETLGLTASGTKAEQAKKILDKAAAKVEMTAKMTPEALYAHIQKLRKDGVPPEALGHLSEQLSKLTVKELTGLKKQLQASGLNVKASGLKAEMVKKIAERALGVKEAVKEEKPAKVEQPVKPENPVAKQSSGYVAELTPEAKAEAAKKLALANRRLDSESDVLGLRKEGPPPNLNRDAFRTAVAAAVKENVDRTTVGPPLDKIYAKVGEQLSLSPRDFQRALADMVDAEHKHPQGQSAMRAGGWPRMLDDISRPDLTVDFGSKMVGYIQPGNLDALAKAAQGAKSGVPAESPAQPEEAKPATKPAEPKAVKPAKEPKQPVKPIDLNDPQAFADAVHEAAKDVPAGVGAHTNTGALPAHQSHKPLISDIYDHMKDQLGGATLDQFKEALERARAAGHVELARNDMPQAVHDTAAGKGHERSKRSQMLHPATRDEQSSFHTLNTNSEKARNRQARPAESPAKPEEAKPATAEELQASTVKPAKQPKVAKPVRTPEEIEKREQAKTRKVRAQGVRDKVDELTAKDRSYPAMGAREIARVVEKHDSYEDALKDAKRRIPELRNHPDQQDAGEKAAREKLERLLLSAYAERPEDKAKPSAARQAIQPVKPEVVEPEAAQQPAKPIGPVKPEVVQPAEPAKPEAIKSEQQPAEIASEAAKEPAKDFGTPEKKDEPPPKIENAPAHMGLPARTLFRYQQEQSSMGRLKEVSGHQETVLDEMLAKVGGDSVTIPELRAQMKGIPRREFDDGLRMLKRAGKIQMEPLTDADKVTDEQRGNGVPGKGETFYRVKKAGEAKPEEAVKSEQSKPEAKNKIPPIASVDVPGHGKVDFVPHRWQGKNETTVMVDPAKLDAAWSQNKQNHLPTEGKGESEVEGRREQFKDFLKKGKPIEASKAMLKDGLPEFDDGRHRFAVLRDAGAKEVAMTVPKKQAAEFEKKFGLKSSAPSTLETETDNYLSRLTEMLNKTPEEQERAYKEHENTREIGELFTQKAPGVNQQGDYPSVLDSQTIRDYVGKRNQAKALRGWGKITNDHMLGDIVKEAGRSAKPRVVSSHEMDDLQKQGWTVSYRGVTEPSHHEEMRNNENWWMGTGAYGNGIYGAVDAPEGAADTWNVKKRTYDFKPAKDIAGNYGGHITRIALSPDSKVVKYSQLLNDMDKEKQELETQVKDGKITRDDYLKIADEVLSDPGRFAALKNYDAINVDHLNQMIFLNRSKIAMQDKDL